MGNYASEFKNVNGTEVKSVTHPSQANWIGEHAAATGLAVVEVERLWIRFQQLGCNTDGELDASVFTRPPASQDIFFKNVLVTFRSADGKIEFQTFCNAMKWAEISNMETKMKAIFNMINNGQPVSKDILLRVLKRVYPGDDQATLESTANSFIEQMDDVSSGVITQTQWVSWARRVPPDQLEELLDFSIVPADINEEAHRAFTSMTNNSQPTPSPGPSDGELTAVARKVKRYDWALLANKLDFTQSDLAQIQNRYYNDPEQQILQMLRQWRQREGRDATKTSLMSALRQCGMNDAAGALR